MRSSLRLGLATTVAILTCHVVYAQTTYYVATNGTDAASGLDWTNALLTISNAVAKTVAGDTVTVSNGTYNITTQINITLDISVQSVNSASVTTIDAGYVSGRRAFNITATNAVLDGFTIKRGKASPGGAVYMTAGTVQNCVIRDSTGSLGGGNQGGGVHMTAGTLRNCTVIGNSSGWNSHGGGIYLAGTGIVENCTMTSNTAVYGGAGMMITGAGIVRNCLINNNAAGQGKTGYGGGINMNSAGAQVLNCTVVGNQATLGGGMNILNGAVINSIIYHNELNGSGTPDDIAGATNKFTYSCSPDLTLGVGNTPAAPEFIDYTAFNYHLLPGSVCTDSGTNLALVTTDIDGSSRPKDGDGNGSAIHDMGVYELDMTTGVFQCDFSTPTTSGTNAVRVLTASVSGTNTSGLYYWWDFENDGTNDLWGTDKKVVTNTFALGYSSVALTVSNALGEVTNRLKTSYIFVAAGSVATSYVSIAGAHIDPFDSWAKAATDIQSAIDTSTNLVLVSNGTYSVVDEIVLNKNISVQSVNGAGVTTIDAGYVSGRRVFSINATNAVLGGFTIKRGRCTPGGGVYMTVGTVQNCVISDSMGANGGGVYMTDGTLRNCTVIKNSSEYNSACGGVNLVGTGIVEDCTITSNSATYGAGGIQVTGAGMVRNCLINNNAAGQNGKTGNGGGINMNSVGAKVLSCTIVGNEATLGGGIQIGSGAVTNSIIYYNIVTGAGTPDNIRGTTNNFGYSCSPDLTLGVGNIAADPVFVDTSSNDYHLLPASPCIEAGTDQSWMATATDLDGNDRILNKAVDMGAYETYVLPRGVVIIIR